MDGAGVVLVTGTSSGFGELIARTLARAGYRVFAGMRELAGRNAGPAHRLQSWADAEGLQLSVVEMDVADDASVQAGVQDALAAAGRIDTVVNNAGIAAGGPLEAFDISQMQELFNINVFGPMRVAKAVLPQMRASRDGLLIQVTSTLGRILPRSGGLYPASKWAAEGLAESLHYQLRPFGIDVVILEPGSFPTPAVSKGLRPRATDIEAEYRAQGQGPARARQASPNYQPPEPQEVADAVLEILRMEPGQRPLRKVVGPIFTTGVEEFNRLYEQYRDQLAESLRRPDQAITWTR